MEAAPEHVPVRGRGEGAGGDVAGILLPAARDLRYQLFGLQLVEDVEPAQRTHDAATPAGAVKGDEVGDVVEPLLQARAHEPSVTLAEGLVDERGVDARERARLYDRADRPFGGG